MEQSTGNEFIENLALALIYLSSWNEGEAGTEVQRAWKGYDFNILDKLKEKVYQFFQQRQITLCYCGWRKKSRGGRGKI